MKDDRIIRSEQMTKKDYEIMKEAVNSFYKKHYRYRSEEEIIQDMLKNPNYIYKDGKFYDKRYMK